VLCFGSSSVWIAILLKTRLCQIFSCHQRNNDPLISLANNPRFLTSTALWLSNLLVKWKNQVINSFAMVGILRKKEEIMEDYAIYPASYQLLDLRWVFFLLINHLKCFMKLCRFLLILEFCEINKTPISVILEIKEKGSEGQTSILKCFIPHEP